MGKHALKWTTLVSNHKLERKDREAKQRWIAELNRAEENIIKDIIEFAPRHLVYLDDEKNTENLKELLNLHQDSRVPPEIGSLGTIEFPKAKPVLGDEHTDPHEEGESSNSDSQSYLLHSKNSQTEDEMFELSLSDEESVEEEETKEEALTNKITEQSKADSKSSDIDDLIVHPTTSFADLIKFKQLAFSAFLKKADNEVRAGWAEQFAEKEIIFDATDQDETLIHEIAHKFCKWAEKEGLSSSVLTVPTIMDLFRFKFTSPFVGEAMLVHVNEMKTVPSILVGKKRELSNRAELFRQVLWDELDWLKTKQLVGFLKRTDVRKHRNKEEPIKYWLTSDTVPKDLLSGETFFKPLLESEILEKFTVWLLEDDNSYKPQYLLKCGYIDTITAKHGGIEKIKELGEKRQNRKRFEGQGYSLHEQDFLKSIKRISEIITTSVPLVSTDAASAYSET